MMLAVVLATHSISLTDAFVLLLPQQHKTNGVNRCRQHLTSQRRDNPRGSKAPLGSSEEITTTTHAKQRQKVQWKKNRKTTTKSFSKNRSITKQNEYIIFNHKITQQETAADILSLLASCKGALSSKGGGGRLSTVNFSTSMHRIAKHLNGRHKNDAGNDRTKILSDPRFALLMCSTADALLDGAELTENLSSKKAFGSRELSNLAWAISKVQIAPPSTVVPIDMENIEDKLRKKSDLVRSTIFEIAKQRASQSSSSSSASPSSWIPALSELCGLLIDAVCCKTLELDPNIFVQQELSNLAYSITIAERPSKEVFEFVVRSMMISAQPDSSHRNNPHEDDHKCWTNNHSFKPQEWSIPLWCLAKSGLNSGLEEELLPFVRDLMDRQPGFLQAFKSQELSNCAWAAAVLIGKREEEASGSASDAALGVLRHVAGELIRRDGTEFSTQELSNVAYSFALLGFGLLAGPTDRNPNMMNSYTYVSSDDPEGDKVLMLKSLSIVFREMKERIRFVSNQELNNVCYVMARLGEKDEELLGLIGQELTDRRRNVAPNDITISLWSMASVGYLNEDLYKACGTRLAAFDPKSLKPNEWSNVLWSFATAGVLPENPYFFDMTLLPDLSRRSDEEVSRDPVTTCFHLASVELLRRLREYKPNEIKDCLWSFVKVGMRHPKLFKAVAEHLVGDTEDPNDIGRALESLDSQCLANFAYVYARHSQLGASILQKYPGKCCIPPSDGRLACFTMAFLDVGEGLLRKLYSRLAKAQLQMLNDQPGAISSQDIANTAWSFAIHGLKHKSHLDSIANVMRTRWMARPAPQMKGQEIANLIWACATLNHTPKGLLDVLEGYIVDIFQNDFDVGKISRVFTRQELANLAFGLCVIGIFPPTLVEIIYVGLLGTGNQRDPSYLQSIYGDTGIEQVHVNSLLYLQIMLDLILGKGAHPFRLPEDFPVAWTSGGSAFSLSSSSFGDGGFLEINTSNTQIAVSKAFDRIGFPHVDEHILSMKDLVEEYGINMGVNPVEVLSVDIANVDSRIGIELDGPGHWVSDISNDATLLRNIGHYRPIKKGVYDYVFKWNSMEQEMNGSTSLKLNLFERLGWKIIQIPFWEWTPVYSNDRLEEEYVERVLRNGLSKY
jgi:hypothetical protein